MRDVGHGFVKLTTSSDDGVVGKQHSLSQAVCLGRGVSFEFEGAFALDGGLGALRIAECFQWRAFLDVRHWLRAVAQG